MSRFDWESRSPYVRPARYEDANLLAALSRRWIPDSLNDLSHGFLKLAYDAESFRQLAEDSSVVVLVVCETVAGYQLVNTLPDHTISYRPLLAALAPHDSAASPDRVGMGVQVLIDEPHQGFGYSRLLLHCLTERVRPRFDWLLSTIHTSNKKSLAVHLELGWKVVGQTEDRLIILRSTIEENQYLS